MIIKFKLFESPDHVTNMAVSFDDSDALPFVFDYDRSVYLGIFGCTHKDSDLDECEGYFGRLWIKSKIISFWTYPEPDNMEEYINELKDKISYFLDENDEEYEDFDIWDFDIEINSYDETFIDMLYNNTIKIINNLINDDYMEKEYFLSHIISKLNININDEEILKLITLDDVINILSNYISSDNMKKILDSNIKFDKNDNELDKYNKLLKNKNKNELSDIINKTISKDKFIDFIKNVKYKNKESKLLNDINIDIYKKIKKDVDVDTIFDIIKECVDPDSLREFISILCNDDFSKNIVPLTDYVKFKEKPKDASDKELLMHLQKPIDKKGNVADRIHGYKQHQMKYKMPGEPEIVAKRRLKNMYQEACDYIYVYGKEISFRDNAIPFIVYYGNDKYDIVVGKKNTTHGEIPMKKSKINFYKTYYGRLFINEKVITFWDYPSKDKFFNILKLLKKKIKKLNINWDEWKVELVKNEIKDEIFYDSIYSPEIYSYIPVKLYNGSKNLPEEIHQQHIVSPMKKKQTNVRQHQIKYKMPGEPEIVAKHKLKHMYQENINEYMRNPQNLKSLFKDIYRGIYKITGVKHEYRINDDIKYSDVLSNNDYRYLKFLIQEIEEKYQKKVRIFLDNFKKRLEEKDIILSYYESYWDKGYDIVTFKHSGKRDIAYSYDIYLKDAKGKRVKPPKYVYHSSPVKNREKIKKEGIKISRPKNWKDAYLSYMPSIFVTADNEDVWNTNYDLWKIDTTKIDNKWWVDLNLHKSFNWKAKALMTLENIPSHAIEKTTLFTDDENLDENMINKFKWFRKKNKLNLEKRYIDLLSSLPEQGMGYQIVDITLKNGKILKERIVLNSTFLKLNDNESIKNEDIEKIEIHL